MKKRNFIFSVINLILITFLITNCSIDYAEQRIIESTATIPASTESVFVPTQDNLGVESNSDLDPRLLWLEPELQQQISLESIEFSFDDTTTIKEDALFWVESQTDMNSPGVLIFEKYYVLTVPFMSGYENFSMKEISEIWSGKINDPDKFQTWINDSAVRDLINIFGVDPGENVIISENIPSPCDYENCLRIIDFSDIEPRWKVISVDQQSPLASGFNNSAYPLVVSAWMNKNPMMEEDIDFEPIIKPSTNFDPSNLTSVLLTGTTALVRNTAYQIEQYGYDFPSKKLKSLFDLVDILHISNEVPFYSSCPPAIPVRPEMRFCSDPSYIEVFKNIEVDVVELTGNHLLDWGPEAFLETISIYEKNGINFYGGGVNKDEAGIPYKFEHNGNKIAFLGCNVTGPENNWATEDRPGALLCDLDTIEDEIGQLVSNGYNPIFTFQHFEFNTFRATTQMREDFSRMAQAGAVVVSGSQAHYPQGMDFVDSSFIHYGLGNFFFDQMYTYWGKAIIDIHYFYNNHYINTHQIAIINENFGQPRIMTTEEKQILLDKLYNNSFYFDQDKEE